MNNSENTADITITLHEPTTGRSESMPLSNTLTIQEVLDLGKALFGLPDESASGNGQWVVTKYGKPLGSSTKTIAQAGVCNGDLLAFLRTEPSSAATATTTTTTTAATPSGGGGLDFSSLLGGASAAAATGSTNSGSNSGSTNGGLNFSNLFDGLNGSANNGVNDTPVYYTGMSFEEALDSNPHPKAIVKLIQTHSHLFKEFNYHMPMLAKQIQQAPSYEKAVEIWRKDMVSNSIRSATALSQNFHKESAFRERLRQNPNDVEAKTYFEQKDSNILVNEQYRQAMQEYPESMGRVLMLYINAKINQHSLQAFVDSGAQMTIMSKSCAKRCGIFHLLDTRFHGMAVGVGTGKILGRIHIVQLQIGDYHFPCSVTIMDDAAIPTTSSATAAFSEENNATKPKDMDLLLGLDMLKRFNCSIDLLDSKLKFRLGGNILETPFLHEKDLDESKGGTKGFDATKANQQLEELQLKYHEKQQEGDSGGKDNNDDDDQQMKE
uniref:Aspartic peptidase DDI1-type domain-containing protein n=1 Tax=Pseudo-nitzschia australis TaxID=44445 RepID=A0A7S4EK08_9STRA|mmetsp:Transcript_1848/g.4096  ORF Transcript_1848/g.4096 Transcript_1848/m.4096 type:complete len:494 (-) Transcript_1848:226-1707(-)|eukprot:CAMPEP_0168179238 /NCGR_PEP_ID=MMETSP0139_2-20121125/9708_1 /TAXON_ID=44445 /ORGANISM="Pseudo-nitzschia australis, Strain 10249 10 AB" /LENGTH=493 /DNA_ID=CAMNT_0008098997 /DNA_START=182 /DNA_END=1663 /DNA_ORIENTATION=+